ncbi:hypothetical protein [Flavobacterium sp. FlaQc-48]
MTLNKIRCTSTITSKDNFVLLVTIIHYWWDKYDWHKEANAYI